MALNGICAAAAYLSHYRALQLGPVAVVSPIGATYAVVGVLLAVVFLDERPGSMAMIGTLVTVAGVMLVSTDLQRFRAGMRSVGRAFRGPCWRRSRSAWPPGSSLGVPGPVRLLRVVGVWASRVAQVICYIPLAILARDQACAAADRRGLAMALIAAVADVVVIGLLAGAERGQRLDHARRQRGVPARRGRALVAPAPERPCRTRSWGSVSWWAAC
ncbi:MAG: EamA family transporter [Actinomycetota bacterium]